MALPFLKSAWSLSPSNRTSDTRHSRKRCRNPNAVKGQCHSCLEHITSVFDFIIPPDVRKVAGHRTALDLGNPLAASLIATLAKKKIMVDPTLTVFKNMLLLSDLQEVNRQADNGHMPARLRDYWDAYRKGQGLSPATLERRRKEFQKYQELTGVL